MKRGMTRSGGDERIELRISIASAADEQDVIVRASGTDLVDNLARTAAERLATSAQLSLWCERRGEHLEPASTLEESGIRWGDRLLLMPSPGEPTHVGGTARVELIVTSGPCAGERFQLGDGAYRLGRDSTLELALTDPSLSRHHLDLRVGAGGIEVADAGSRNGTAVGDDVLQPNSYRKLSVGQELELGRSLLQVRGLHQHAVPARQTRAGRVEFNRQPRVNSPHDPMSRVIKAPPSRARKARLPLAASLLPLGAGVLLFVLLDSPIMLAIAGLSPLMAIATFISDRRGGKRSFANETMRFESALEEALGDLDAALVEEERLRRERAPDVPTLIARLDEPAPTLWERRAGGGDFLELRLGLADLPAHARIELESGGDPELRAAAERRLAERATIRGVPLTLNVREMQVVGLTGPRQMVDGLARWLVLQAAILHSPADLTLLAALAPSALAEWSCLKWLPHLRPDRVGLQSPAVVSSTSQSEALVREIGELARRRAQVHTGPVSHQAQVLLVLDEGLGIDRSLLTATLADLEDQGISVIWIGGDPRDLPGQTAAIVRIEQGRAVLSLTEVATGVEVADVSADALTLDVATRSARLLAPIKDVSELARAGDIPARIGLLDLLDLLPPTPEAIESRWRKWQGELRSTVGVGIQGAITLDLRAEGPHALIAGTTGSGKSELLRTFVASAAASAPPDRLSFLLVDYKGGAAFAPCASLPHVVDVVSDLDEHLAERALISLEAELKRRERLLAEHGARDLAEMLQRDPAAAPPFLVIAVDEFAKLREEVPQFVDGVVDIAQRGRSLGVHMVLAAQTLRNAFTPAIRANTNLRLALRVAEESESEDMISSPLAARIPSGERSRGRAFSRTGHGELREFQTAYVSGRTELAESLELRIERYDLDGSAIASATVQESESDRQSDLTAIGAAAREAQAQAGIERPPRPWLPTLPETLGFDQVEHSLASPATAALGLVDLPHLQRQDPLVVDLANAGHLAVFGAGNSGKTTALTSLGLALAHGSEPEQLHIYGLDAASGDLCELEALPHCGAVMTVGEEERVHRLLAMLARRVERRGRGDRASDDVARIVLMLDDLGSFADHYDRPGLESPYEQLQRILSGGRAAGVHVALTASRRGALPAALAAHIGARLVLRMTTEEDMLSLGLDAKAIRGARLPIGRGFTEESREFQIAVPTVQIGGRSAKIPLAEAASSMFEKTSARARAIEVLPAEVSRSSLPRSRSLAQIALGMSDDELGPALVDLEEMHLLVVGPYRSGRSTTLETLYLSLREAEPGASFHLLAPRRSRLIELDGWSGTAMGTEACGENATALLDRHEAGDFEQQPAFVFVDDGGELGEAKVTHDLERLVRLGRDSSLRIVAAVESGAARGIGNSWIRELRREGHGILLQPDLAADGDLFATTLPRRTAAPLLPGRGFLVSRGTSRLIQIAGRP